MIYQAIDICPDHIPFVDYIFRQNNEALHGGQVSIAEWYTCLCLEVDSDERNFIITVNGEYAAWMKLNGLNTPGGIYIAMLVVAKEHQQNGVGRFAVRFAEDFARAGNKDTVWIQTTQDNLAAVDFYLKQGYRIDKHIRYAVGDGVFRDGYRFKKQWKVSR